MVKKGVQTFSASLFGFGSARPTFVGGSSPKFHTEVFLVKSKVLVICALFVSTGALAGELSIKPEVIYSTSQLRLGNEKFTTVSGATLSSDVSNSRFVKGLGGALNLEYELNDRIRAGAGVGHVSYNEQHGSNQPNFSDLFGKAQLSYDFLKVGDLSAYAAGGASYHMVSLNTERGEGFKIDPSDVQLWNWDAGLGARLKASDNVSLGLEYRVTNTFNHDRMKVKYAAGDQALKTDVNRVNLSTNEVLTSLSYNF